MGSNRSWGVCGARWLFALLALSGAGAVHACTCAPPRTPLADLAAHPVVFRGRVIHAETRPQGQDVYFAVTRIWKGLPDPLQVASTLFNCARQLEPGAEYLVYGPLVACNRTRLLSEAAEDLAALGPGEAPRAAAAPELVRHRNLSGYWYHPARSGEGLIVEVLEDRHVAVTWFGFDPDDPQRQMWLSGVGEIQDTGAIHVPALTRPSGGGFGQHFDPDQVARPVWGALWLDLGVDTGSVRYEPLVHPGPIIPPQALSFPLVRLTRPPAPPVPD
jgi:hypothetical protein